MHVSCLFLFIECPIGYFGRNCADKCPPPLFGRLCGHECPHNCKSCHYIFGCTIIKERKGKVSQINLLICFSFSYVSIEACISCLLYFNFFLKQKRFCLRISDGEHYMTAADSTNMLCFFLGFISNIVYFSIWIQRQRQK